MGMGNLFAPSAPKINPNQGGFAGPLGRAQQAVRAPAPPIAPVQADASLEKQRRQQGGQQTALRSQTQRNAPQGLLTDAATAGGSLLA